MKFYCDTEFTDFLDPQLISIALVVDHNRHFYAILNDYRKEDCSPFVVTDVLPILFPERANVVGTSHEVSLALREWVKSILPPDEQVYIAMDYSKDYAFAHWLLTYGNTIKDIVIHPSWCDPCQDPVGLHEHQSYFVAGPDRHRHNALDDAFALRRASIAVSMTAYQGENYDLTKNPNCKIIP